MAGLTTHVLDTVNGRPAAGVGVILYEVTADGGRRVVADVVTNADGRTDAPLIPAAEARGGRFELHFHIGDYFRKAGLQAGTQAGLQGSLQAGSAPPPFLDIVPIHFGIADPSAHYHVPLVATPWSYATYRGS